MPTAEFRLKRRRDVANLSKWLFPVELGNDVAHLIAARCSNQPERGEQRVLECDVVQPAFDRSVSVQAPNPTAAKRLAGRLYFLALQRVQKRLLRAME